MPGQRYEVELAVSATGVFEVEKLKKDIIEIQNAAKSKINAINISVDSTKDIAKLRRSMKDLMSDKDKMDKKLSDIKIKAPSSIDSDFSSLFEESVYNIDSAITLAEHKIADFEDYVKSLGSNLKSSFSNAKIDLKNIIDTGDADEALDLMSKLSDLLFYIRDADPNLDIIDASEVADAERLEIVLNNLFSILKGGLQTNLFDNLKQGMTSLGLDTTNLEDRLRKALSGNAIQGAIDNLTNKINSVKQKLSNHQYVNTDEIEKERAELNGLVSDLEQLTTMDSALKRSVSSVKGLLTKEFNQLRINESNTVFSDIKPNTKEWNLIVDKIKEAKDGAEQINRILKSSSLDSDGNIVERYQVERSNASGSKKITSQYTKQSDGTLSQNSEKVTADLQKERSAAEAATKAYNKLWEEAERANEALNTTSNTVEKLSKSKPKELTSQFSTLENDIENANRQLKNGELTVSEYSKKVEKLISDYQKLVNIQQKRDVETYNENVKAAEQHKKEKQSETDKAAKEQLSAYEEIKKLKFEISKTTDTDTLSSLKSQLKIEQDRFINASNILKANSAYFDKDAQILKLTQARLEAEEKIAKYKADQRESQAKEEQKAIESARKEALSKSESEQKVRQSEVDKALKDQQNAFGKIQDIKYQLSHADDADEISILLERQKLYQEEFANAGKILTANSELYSVEKQTNELTKIRLEYEQKIAEYKADQASQKSSDNSKKWDKFVKEQEDYLTNKFENDAIARNKKAYQDLIDTIQEYSEVSKRIASNQALDGDIELAEKLENKIFELQKQPILSSSQIDESERKLVKLFNQLDVLEKKNAAKNSNNESNALKKAWDDNVKIIREYADAVSDLNNLKAKDNGTGKYSNEIALQIEKIQKLELAAKDAKTALSSMANPHTISVEGWKEYLNIIKEFDQAAYGSAESIAKLKDAQLSSIQGSINSYLDDYKKRNIKPTNENRSNEYQQLLDKYKASIDALKAKKDELAKQPTISDADRESVRQMTDAIEENKNALIAMSAAEKGSTEGSRRKEIDKITKYLKDNTRISEEAKQKLKAYLDLLRSGDPSVNVEKIHNEFLRVTEAERLAGNEGKRFIDIIKDKTVYGLAAQIASYYLSIMDMVRYANNAVTAVRELDTALIDLKKTTTMNDSELETFYYDANDVAKQMGVTTAEIINQASAWSRLGYSSKTVATEMAELSSQFASISPGMSTEDAQEGLVSIMKAKFYALMYSNMHLEYI